MEPIRKATFAAISCVHVPFENNEAKAWMLAKLSDNPPTHFIMLGDLFDAGEVSVHPSETSMNGDINIYRTSWKSYLIPQN